jgi:branched-subunit amino acid aminotransferase/4-amino-4-deoxychorismate lyase
MGTTHYLNGEFVTEERLLISPRDLGFSRGYAVFDFFRTYSGHKPFMFDCHVDRLFNSAKAIGLSMPWSKEDVKNIIVSTLEKNNAEKEFAVRTVVTGGVSASLAPTSPTLMVILDDILIFPKSMYENGIKVATINHKRYNPGSKTTHYVEAIRRWQEMQEEGIGEILYTSDGSILEGTFSNFFCVVGNKLVTAKNNILPGVTRRVVIEKLKHGIPVKVRNLKLHELDSATEAFISVSGKGIVPVVVVDDKMIGDGRVGPVTKAVMNKFNEFVASDNW